MPFSIDSRGVPQRTPKFKNRNKKTNVNREDNIESSIPNNNQDGKISPDLRDKSKRVFLNLSVDEKFKKQVQMQCIIEGMSVNKFMMRITRDYLRNKEMINSQNNSQIH